MCLEKIILMIFLCVVQSKLAPVYPEDVSYMRANLEQKQGKKHAEFLNENLHIMIIKL